MIALTLRSLRSDDRGAAVIEMAFVAPIFALLVIGISDMSNAYSQKLALEQGAQRSIEKVMQTTGVTTVADTIKTEAVCQVNGVNTNGTCKTAPISASNVTVTYRLECKDSGGGITSQTNTDAATFDDLDCPTSTTNRVIWRCWWRTSTRRSSPSISLHLPLPTAPTICRPAPG